jgi:predicted nucleic acid-binding protein
VTGFLIDTNVISELIRPRPDPRVRDWVEGVAADLLYLSVLTLGELRKGIDLHPDPVRRARVDAWLVDTLLPWFEGRILTVDQRVADRWGSIAARGQASGSPLPVIDGLLAATALCQDLTLVTRNIRDVECTGVPALDPWEALTNGSG